jgi:moderate conductance mechanosensitive channel
VLAARLLVALTVSPQPDPTTPTAAATPTAAGVATAAARRSFAWVDTILKWLLGTPLEIVLTVIGAILLRFVVHRVIDRIADGIATGQAGLGRLDGRLSSATAILSSSPLLSARREQRARTTASVLKSATSAAVAIILVLTVLQDLNYSIATLLAGASVIGVAIGLGAQALIKDIIAGIFMIIEDQYGVGDVVDLGQASGTVEAVGLRVTRLRDADGAVWYLRNGEVVRVGNHSQGWARAVLDVGLAHDQDVKRAQSLLVKIAHELAADDTFAPMLLEEPQVWGVEAITTDAVVVRVVVRTKPQQQWVVARELRRRILDRFVAEGLPAPTGLEAVIDPGTAA